MREPPAIAPTAPRSPHVAWLVAAAALVAHAWIFALPFQLDDYRLLPEPLASFRRPAADAYLDYRPFHLRFPAWLLWAALRPLAGDPMRPWPYHAASLALHAATSALLALVVARALGGATGRRAGLLAGLVFAVGAGGIQAVSWPSSVPDVLVALFGLGALRAGLASNGRESRARLATLGACLLACLLSKASSAVVPPLLLVVLWARAVRTRRAPVRATLVVAGAWGVGLFARLLFLGHVSYRYGARSEGLSDLARSAAGVPSVLAQALYPWNRSALFAGEEPWLARLLAGTDGGPGIVALVSLLAWPLLALAAKPRSAPALALCLALALGAALPAATVLAPGTNQLSRAFYLPLCAAAAGLGVALATLLGARRWRVAGGVGCALVGLLLADGLVHVARTELVHARERALERERILATAAAWEREHGAPPAVLAILPEADFGGIPTLDLAITLSLRPPFAPEPGLHVVAVHSGPELVFAWPDLDLGERAVVLFAPACDERWNPRPLDPAASGPQNRERRRLRQVAPVRPGLGPGGLGAVRLHAEEDGRRWRAEPAIPAHALAGVRLDFREGDRVEGELVLLTATRSFAFECWPLAAPRDGLSLAPVLPIDALFGEPLSALAWEGARAPRAPPRLEASAPRLALAAPPPRSELALDPRSPPRFELAELPPSSAGRLLRVDLRRRTTGGALFVAAESAAAGREVVLDPVLLGGLLGAEPEISWEEFTAFAARPLARAGFESFRVEWRASVRAGPRLLSGRSELRQAVFVSGARRPDPDDETR